MELTCLQDNLKKAIAACEKAVSKKNTLPILNNLLLEADKNSLKIAATNLEIGITAKIGAKVEEKGRITVPAKLIGNFFLNLPSCEKIFLKSEGDEKIKIKSGLNKAIIKGVLADDFPLIPSRNNDFVLNVPNNIFQRIFSKISASVAINEARQELTGVNVILGEKEIFWATTDSFRLSEYKFSLKKMDINQEEYQKIKNKNNDIIIPFGILTEINRILSGDDESGNQLKIAIEESQIFFETNKVKLVSRLINGKYPQYQHIIPKKYTTKLICEKEAIQKGIKLAGIFVSGNANEVRLKIDSKKKKVFILASGAETGENSTELKFEPEGPSQEVVFNARYLLDGINASSTNKIAILINNDSTPIVIKEFNEEKQKILNDFTYVVMPIKK